MGLQKSLFAESRLIPRYYLDDPRTEVYVGDCREVLAYLPEKSVDLIFADPPFNWNVPYSDWDDNMKREDYLEFTYEWLDACIRVLAPRGSLWVNIPDDWAAEVVVYLKGANAGATRGEPTQSPSGHEERRGEVRRTANVPLALINWCVWHFRFGQCRDSSFIVSKAHVLYFARDRKKRIWNADAILESSDRAALYNDARTRRTRRPGLRVPLDVWYGPYLGRIQGNNKERRPGHRNQIPEVYMRRVISACSNEGDLILDPFLGSGTTCTVARALNRRSIGIEFSEPTAKSAFDRIKEGAVRVGSGRDPFVLSHHFRASRRRTRRKPTYSSGTDSRREPVERETSQA